MYPSGIEPRTLQIMGSSFNHWATTADADDRHCVLLQYIIDAGAMAATMGAGAAAVSNRYPSYPTLSQFNILLYPSTLSQFNILLYPRASPAAASRGTVTAPLPARGDGTAACPGRRRPAPARGYYTPRRQELFRSVAKAVTLALWDRWNPPLRGVTDVTFHP